MPTAKSNAPVFRDPHIKHFEAEPLEFYRHVYGEDVEDDGEPEEIHQFYQFGLSEQLLISDRFLGKECQVFTDLISVLPQCPEGQQLLWELLGDKGGSKAIKRIIDDYANSMMTARSYIFWINVAGSCKSIGSAAGSYIFHHCLDNHDGARKRMKEILDTIEGHEPAMLLEINERLSSEPDNNGRRYYGYTKEEILADLGDAENPDEVDDCTIALRAKIKLAMLVLELIADSGKGDELHQVVAKYMPNLLKEDCKRSTPYVDDLPAKSWDFGQAGAVETFFNNIRQGSMVSVLFENKGWFTKDRAHWVSMGKIKDKEDKLRYALWDSKNGLVLCRNMQQVERQFDRLFGHYVRAHCISLVINPRLACEFDMSITPMLEKLRNGHYTTAAEYSEGGHSLREVLAQKAGPYMPWIFERFFWACRLVLSGASRILRNMKYNIGRKIENLTCCTKAQQQEDVEHATEPESLAEEGQQNSPNIIGNAMASEVVNGISDNQLSAQDILPASDDPSTTLSFMVKAAESAAEPATTMITPGMFSVI